MISAVKGKTSLTAEKREQSHGACMLNVQRSTRSQEEYTRLPEK